MGWLMEENKMELGFLSFIFVSFLSLLFSFFHSDFLFLFHSFLFLHFLFFFYPIFLLVKFFFSFFFLLITYPIILFQLSVKANMSKSLNKLRDGVRLEQTWRWSAAWRNLEMERHLKMKMMIVLTAPY